MNLSYFSQKDFYKALQQFFADLNIPLNPVFLPDDIDAFGRLVSTRGLSEEGKAESREKIAGRIMLLHEVMRKGLEALSKKDASLVEGQIIGLQSLK